MALQWLCQSFWQWRLQTCQESYREKEREKYGEIIIKKVGKVICLGFDTKKKVVVAPKKRIPAKKEVPRQFSSWRKRWSPINESRFTDDVFDCLLSNGVVLVE